MMQIDPQPERQEQEVEALYQESLMDFQNGRWDKAAVGFEGVLRLQPEHAAARAFLDETRLKASLEQSQPKPKRALLSGRLRWVLLLLSLAVLAAVAVPAARYLYNRWVTPQQATQQALQERAARETRAYQLLANRDYTGAEKEFNDLLATEPDNSAWSVALQQVQQRRSLDENYAQAEAAIAAKDWPTAESVLQGVIAVDPKYGDAQFKLMHVQQQAALSSAFAKAELAFAAGEWAQAAMAYEDLVDMNADYEKATVATRLFDCYFQQATELVETSKGSLEALVEAKGLLQKALSLRPQHELASLQVSLADKYLEAQKLIIVGDRPAAETILRWVVEQQPTYAGGNAALLLRGSAPTPVPSPTPIPAAATPELPAPTPSEPAPGPTKPAPVVVVEPESEFLRQFALSMREGDQAMAQGDSAAAEKSYRAAAAAALHGGSDSARFLFVSYVKLGTAVGKKGDLAGAADLVKTALSIITRSATAIPAELYESAIQQGDAKAANGDFLAALRAYDPAVQVIAGKCNCGLEKWSIVP